MKYIFIISFFFISSFAPLHVHAGAAGGSATMPLQLSQIALETPTKIASIATALSTGQDMVKNVILDPIANALISAALEGASNDILSWVSGGHGGSDPLIIGDPQAYINNAGLEALGSSLAGIPTDSVFGDSIFNTLLQEYKGAGDTAEIIKNLSKSDIPSMLQDNLCNEDKLTSLALDAVANEDGSYAAEELVAKKMNSGTTHA